MAEIELTKEQKNQLAYFVRTGAVNKEALDQMFNATDETADEMADDIVINVEDEDELPTPTPESLKSIREEEEKRRAEVKAELDAELKKITDENKAALANENNTEVELERETKEVNNDANSLALENAKYKAILKYGLQERHFDLIDGATPDSIMNKAKILAEELTALKGANNTKTVRPTALPSKKDRPMTRDEEVKSLIAEHLKDNKLR